MTRVVVLAGGVGGGKFLLGVREALRRREPDGRGGTTAEITAIVNTADDLWLAGLRISPDLDSVLYALAGVGDPVRGWGRAGETERVSAELREWGVGWPWFTLGDLDLGTSIARSSWLRDGLPLSAIVERLSARWPLGVRLLPMTDAEVETQVAVRVGERDGTGTRSMHFQEWWTRHRAALPAVGFTQPGMERAVPAPGVLDAIAAADVVLFAPSNPVVSLGPILGVPGVREAIAAAGAPVVGVSPIIGGAAVRGMADACLSTIGVETSAAAVALHYGARAGSGVPAGGLLDGWVVDSRDAGAVGALTAVGMRAVARDILMVDVRASARIAGDALELAGA